MQPVIRRIADIEPEVWDDPVRGQLAFRVVFSRGTTPTGALCTGLAELAPGGWLGRHRHAEAEVYHVVDGAGAVFLDGDERPVRAGDAVFIPGDAEHGIRTVGDAPLRIVYAFATDSSDDVGYRFSAERS